MAMQVAHEIKNPLTPIKLGVQQLERAWKDERPDFGERLEHFCKVAAIQIDVLSEISTDFSLIADLGVQGLEKVELSSLLEEVVGLFQSVTSSSEFLSLIQTFCNRSYLIVTLREL